MGDNGLLQEFAASRSEAAFAALVGEHMNLVFATACRQLGNHSLAEEVTQSVFVALARKAGSLGRHPTVAGWLHKATLLECRRVLRTELRRQRCEQVAVSLGTLSAAGESVWASLVPFLDEALLQLNENDRLAVLLRFLEEKPLREVGQALGASEDAAQKRVARALSQMTDFFRQRGFAVPALTASAPIFAAATHAAPVALTNTVVAASLASAHTASTLTILSFMTMTKLKLGAVSALIVAAITVPIIQQSRLRQLAAENSQLLALSPELATLQQERDQATNRLRLMQEELNRSSRDVIELARLRGEVSRLRNAGQEPATVKAAQRKSADEQAEEVRKQNLIETAANIRTRLKDLAEQRERLAQGLQRTRPKRPQGAAELQLLQGLSPEEVEALGKDPAKLKALMESPQAQHLRETAKSSSVLDTQIAQMSALEQALTNRLNEVEAALNSAPSGNGQRNTQTAPR